MKAILLIVASAFAVLIAFVDSSPILREEVPIKELILTDENLTRIPEYVASYIHVEKIKIIGTKITQIAESDLRDYKRLKVLDISESGINVVNCTMVDNLCLIEIITGEGQEIECDRYLEKIKVNQYETRNFLNSSCTEENSALNDTATIINGNQKKYLNVGSTFFQPTPVLIFVCLAFVMCVFFIYKCYYNQTEERDYKKDHAKDNHINEKIQLHTQTSTVADWTLTDQDNELTYK